MYARSRGLSVWVWLLMWITYSVVNCMNYGTCKLCAARVMRSSRLVRVCRHVHGVPLCGCVLPSDTQD